MMSPKFPVKMTSLEMIADYNEKSLLKVPEEIREMGQLKMLYLRENLIEELPEDFFDVLEHLLWLDLRNNRLQSIPLGVGQHTHLETLLIQDNRITHLPNELGIVPTLRVLQMSGNPILYPPTDVINAGADQTINFLRNQYYNPTIPSKPIRESDEEKIMCVIDNRKNSSEISLQSNEIQEILTKAWSKSSASAIRPALSIKSLFREPAGKSLAKKTHSLTKRPSRIRLQSRSFSNSNRYVNSDKLPDEFDREKGMQHDLKESWMVRLKELLDDQEQILQQEKNVSELSRWRMEKKMELPRTTASENQVVVPPYGTYSVFNRMLSRSDLQQQVTKMIRKYEETSKVIDIQRMVNNVVTQLKNLESAFGDESSPRSRQHIANKEIQSLKNLHSQIRSLQLQNSRQ